MFLYFNKKNPNWIRQGHRSTMTWAMYAINLLIPEPNGWYFADDIGGLMQGRRNSSTLVIELRLSCTNPSTFPRAFSWKKGLCILIGISLKVVPSGPTSLMPWVMACRRVGDMLLVEPAMIKGFWRHMMALNRNQHRQVKCSRISMKILSLKSEQWQ